MSKIRRAFFVLVFVGSATGSVAEVPLSAIDWLSESVATAPAGPLPAGPETENPVTDKAALNTLTVVSIDGPSLDALGLLPVSQSGLPYDLWAGTPSVELSALLTAERVETLPVIQSLLLTLLLAELAPPQDAVVRGQLFLARVDKLLDLGALDQALTLLEQVENPPAEVFRRWFDIALLLGQEDRACTAMVANPEIAPTFPARIFCLARGGDWNAAALSLRTGEALGYIDSTMAELLTRFLDPVLFEGEPEMPLPQRPSPLVFRLMEAIGQPLQTTTLPLAFAQADLRSNSGWKTRIEAAERLARTGAIDENLLLGLYTERKAAASGGVWERVKAIQELEKALRAKNIDRISVALPVAWQQMMSVELEVPLAKLFGQEIAMLPLTGDAAPLAFRIGLLSDGYDVIASARNSAVPDERFLIGLARGQLDNIAPPDQLGSAIKSAFDSRPPLPSDALELLQKNRKGEAILRAIDGITEGAKGDLRRITEGLFLLRQVGLDSTARRAGLELLLLERRG